VQPESIRGVGHVVMLFVQEIICATCAGCVSTLIGHPLDTIKVHLQSNHKLISTKNAAKSLLRQSSGNPFIFFRGIGPPMVNAILMNTVMFSVFNSAKEAFGVSQNIATGGGAALVAGIATAFLSTPIDFVKIQSQLSGRDSSSILIETVRRNPISLFRGHSANLGREGLFTMVYLGLYDQLLKRNEKVVGFTDSDNNNLALLLQVAAVSSMTGGLAWIVSYPFDTIKTRMQGGGSCSITFRSAVQELWKVNGYLSFYKGCGASTGRAILVTSFRMIIYESIKNHCF